MIPEGSRRIIVTGATKGLGRSTALALDQLGHRTLLVGRDQDALTQLQRELQGAKVMACDLGELGLIASIVERAVTEFGGVDGVINNAGTIEPIDFLQEADPSAWARAIELNLTAPALLMRAALPHLIQSAEGRIVNISTGAAIKAMPGWGAYCASKAGLLHLTKVVAAEAPTVGCFSLRPGVINTGMQSTIRRSEGMRHPDRQRFLDLHSQGALEAPEVPAKAAIWLVLQGPLARSGELIDYTDPEVVAGIPTLWVEAAPPKHP